MNTASSAYDNTVRTLHKHHAEIQDFTIDEDDRIVFAQAPVASMKVSCEKDEDFYSNKI